MRPWAVILRSHCLMDATPAGSMLSNGSSRNSSSGRVITAAANATRLRMPALNSESRFLPVSAVPWRPAARPRAAARSPRPGRTCAPEKTGTRARTAHRTIPAIRHHAHAPFQRDRAVRTARPESGSRRPWDRAIPSGSRWWCSFPSRSAPGSRTAFPRHGQREILHGHGLSIPLSQVGDFNRRRHISSRPSSAFSRRSRRLTNKPAPTRSE